MTTHIQDIPTCAVRRCVDGTRGAIGQPSPLHVPPEMVHGIQLGGGSGQKAEFNVQVLGHRQACIGEMRRATVLKQHDVPAAPMRADHREEGLRRLLHPLLGDQQAHVAAPDIDHPMQNTLGTLARDGHAHLFPDAAVAVV